MTFTSAQRSSATLHSSPTIDHVLLEIDGDRITGTADYLDRLDGDVPPLVEVGTFEATCS